MLIGASALSGHRYNLGVAVKMALWRISKSDSELATASPAVFRTLIKCSGWWWINFCNRVRCLDVLPLLEFYCAFAPLALMHLGARVLFFNLKGAAGCTLQGLFFIGIFFCSVGLFVSVLSVSQKRFFVYLLSYLCKLCMF